METNMNDNYKTSDPASEYIAVVAEEDGVNIIGITRGRDTKFHHTEKLDKGEVYIAQFTENTSAIKIHGKSKIYTKMGIVQSGE
jgi:transcription attenuation protein (tryptophan RNA-binding attenuator protein)